MYRVVLAVLLASTVASADEPEPEQPRVSQVHGRLEGATATFKVRYLVRTRRGELALDRTFSLPRRASVIAATASFGGVSRRLDLVAADEAERQFDAIRQREPSSLRRWAVALSGRTGVTVVRSAIATPSTGTLAIELELEMPACFERDARHVPIPGAWRAALDPTLRALQVKPTSPDAPCGFETSADDLWLAFPAHELASKPDSLERVGAFAGRVVLGDQHVVRFELDTAGKLSDMPRDLATAIVVDNSRSLSQPERDAQRSFVAAYLREAPADSRVQVIGYARHATPLLPAWTAVASARTQTDRVLASLVPRNGSNFDDALVEASRWLATVHGARRIVLVTDERFATRLDGDPTALAAQLPPGTVVQVAAISGYDGLYRDDDIALAKLATATEGLAMRAGKLDPKASYPWLIRPTTLEQVTIKAPGWRIRSSDSGCGDELGEGTSCVIWADGFALAGPIAVEGYLWTRKVSRIVRPDPAHAKQLARELQYMTNPLELGKRIEVAARAINTRWSLYGEWGGTGGYSDTFVVSGESCCGELGTSSISGHGSSGTTCTAVGASLPPLDLSPQLAGPIAACNLNGATATAAIEAKLDEIVDVAVTISPANPALQTCVTDAIWNTAITIPKEYPHQVTRVVVR
ncbi:MAG: vWA domain-containing protein [Kofleriaceae bacterium]